MIDAFTGLLSWLTTAIPQFLIGEPAIYFVAGGLLVFVISLVFRLLKGVS